MITWHKIEQHNPVASDEKATEIIRTSKSFKSVVLRLAFGGDDPAGKLQPIMLTKPPHLQSTSTARPDSVFDNHHNDQITAQDRYIVFLKVYERRPFTKCKSTWRLLLLP